MGITVVAINGTPGSGKTTVANHLKKQGREVINLGEFAVEHGCVIEYDEECQCNVIDDELLEEKIRLYLKSQPRGTFIFEGHLADVVPSEFLDKCFVLGVRIPDLVSRLRERGYPAKKIEDNKVSELMKDCYMYSLDTFGEERVEFIDPAPLDEVVARIEEYIRKREEEK